MVMEPFELHQLKIYKCRRCGKEYTESVSLDEIPLYGNHMISQHFCSSDPRALGVGDLIGYDLVRTTVTEPIKIIREG